MRPKVTARELFSRAFHRMTRKLSLSEKLTAEEQLEYVLREDRRQRFIADILSIRRNGDYVPNYNKPKKYADLITDISGKTYIKCERPENFIGADGSLINACGTWLMDIKEAHAKQVELKQLQKLQSLQRENVMTDLKEAMIKKMLVVD